MRASNAIAAWAVAWLGGSVLSSVVAGLSGADTIADAGPAWLLAAQLAMWVPMVVAVWLVQQSRWDGLRPAVERAGLRFAVSDLVGVPLGIVTQLVLVRAVYLPLVHWWPHTFDLDHIEKSARTLYESATGHTGGIVLLVLVVVIGAPLVEELVYRGMLQTAIVDRWGERLGVVAVALWFALIHLQPVNIPGLFVIGLVLGVAQRRERRLGLSIVTHLAFNATGLWLVSR